MPTLPQYEMTETVKAQTHDIDLIDVLLDRLRGFIRIPSQLMPLAE